MSDDDRHTIPSERLPAGFAESVDEPPPTPAEPAAAATVVLLRDGADGLEVLLLRRHRQSGFVPGAYVFPGGRVDASDANAELLGAVDALPAEPPPPFWFAAVREAFEETGVLLARRVDGSSCAVTHDDAELQPLRTRLLADEIGLLDVVRALDARIDLREAAWCAHWITPIAEPRRYDTHFFVTVVPAGCAVRIDEREMSDARWLRPFDALKGFETGELPMVFPTVRTLEQLRRFTSASDAIEHFRNTKVETVLPRLVRRPRGIGIVVDDERDRNE